METVYKTNGYSATLLSGAFLTGALVTTIGFSVDVLINRNKMSKKLFLKKAIKWTCIGAGTGIAIECIGQAKISKGVDIKFLSQSKTSFNPTEETGGVKEETSSQETAMLTKEDTGTSVTCGHDEGGAYDDGGFSYDEDACCRYMFDEEQYTEMYEDGDDPNGLND